MWEMYKSVLECPFKLLKDYHGKNPLVERGRRFGKSKQYKTKKVTIIFVIICKYFFGTVSGII